MITMMVMIYLGIVAILLMTYLVSLKPSSLKRHIYYMKRVVFPFNTRHRKKAEDVTDSIKVS